MSSSKKTTSKATKSPAPATKEKSAAKPATKKSTAKAPLTKPQAAAAAIVAAVARAAAAPIVAAAPAPAPTPAPVAVKEVATKPVPTVITAKIDVGFGNALYVRGEGPGLSWDRGVAMSCLGNDTWQAELAESARPYTFKFLVNDLSWSAGEDFQAPSGSQLTFVPTF